MSRWTRSAAVLPLLVLLGMLLPCALGYQVLVTDQDEVSSSRSRLPPHKLVHELTLPLLQVRQVCSGMYGGGGAQDPYIEGASFSSPGPAAAPRADGRISRSPATSQSSSRRHLEGSSPSPSSSGTMPSGSASAQTGRVARTTGPPMCVLARSLSPRWRRRAQRADTLFVLQRIYICTIEAQTAGLCTTEQLGLFLTAPGTPDETSISTSSVRFDAVPSASGERQTSRGPFRYDVGSTGYYCVATVPLLLEGATRNTSFTGVVDFENVFGGHLPAAEYPKVAVRLSLSHLSRI